MHNCVSFTNLFIALARSLGSDAHAALAFGIPDKEMVGELILVSSHLVATVRDNKGRTIYDFQLNRSGVLVGYQPIDDLRLTAIYLNNRGVENLLSENLDSARNYLEASVRLVPDFADAYSNLAVVYRRQGNLDRARDTYILALGVDPGNTSIHNNLLVLYSMLVGERRVTSEAEQLLLEGDQELSLGRVTPALAFYRRATQLEPASAPAHVAAARALLVKGQIRKALKSLRRALEADPDNADALRLMTGLDRLERR